MKLPGGDRAIVPPGKLENYCLAPDHVDGGHKARVFASALGLTGEDVDVLRRALLEAARTEEAAQVGMSSYGPLYRVRFVLSFKGRTAVIRSGWIVRDDGLAYLTTALVEKVR